MKQPRAFIWCAGNQSKCCRVCGPGQDRVKRSSRGLARGFFSRQMKCFGLARGQRNLWAVVFLLDQWLSSCGLLTPGGLWAALRRPVKGNQGKKTHFCCMQLPTQCCFPRDCISFLSWELLLLIVRSMGESGRGSAEEGGVKALRRSGEGVKAKTVWETETEQDCDSRHERLSEGGRPDRLVRLAVTCLRRVLRPLVHVC